MERIPDRDKKNSGLPLLAILLVIALVITTVWYREGDSGPLHSVRKGVTVVATPIGKAGSWAFTPARSVSRFFANLNVDRSEISTLRSQNSELRARVMQLEESRLEAERLRKLMGIKDALEMDSVGARVIHGSVNNWSRTIVIDKGSDEGIQVGMPVLGAEGLLGQTIEVGPHSATVRLIQDEGSGVAAMLQSNRAEGVVNGAVDNTVVLDFISKETSVTVGDVVITSGLGGVFPKGIVIGEVSEIDDNSSSVYRSIKIEPAAKVSGIEEVIVIVNPVTAPVGAAQ